MRNAVKDSEVMGFSWMGECKQYFDDGDWSLERLYAVHDSFIRSVIEYAVRNHEERDDVYQEVFLVLSKKSDFRDIDNIQGYLYRIVINKVNELARRQVSADMRIRKYFEFKAQETDAAEDKQPAASDEARQVIRLIRENLSDKESQALLLRFQDGYDNATAATVMNVKKETFVHYISVGLKKIRTIVKGRHPSE